MITLSLTFFNNRAGSLCTACESDYCD